MTYCSWIRSFPTLHTRLKEGVGNWQRPGHCWGSEASLHDTPGLDACPPAAVQAHRVHGAKTALTQVVMPALVREWIIGRLRVISGKVRGRGPDQMPRCAVISGFALRSPTRRQGRAGAGARRDAGLHTLGGARAS